jgi:DNA-binding HxlR family transcriptional regulator
VDQSRADGRKQFYSLSPIGAHLRPVIRSIDHWGREYSTEIAGIGR